VGREGWVRRRQRTRPEDGGRAPRAAGRASGHLSTADGPSSPGRLPSGFAPCNRDARLAAVPVAQRQTVTLGGWAYEASS
jgi:hypothetical protein